MFLLFLLNTTLRKHEPNFCFNCRYFLPNNLFPKYSLCSKFIREEKKIEYLITGKQEFIYEYCLTVRNDENKCGYLGKKHEIVEEKEL